MRYIAEPLLITKIKIFANDNLGKLENDVNEFIENKIVVDIKYTQAPYRCDKAMVIYREYKEE